MSVSLEQQVDAFDISSHQSPELGTRLVNLEEVNGCDAELARPESDEVVDEELKENGEDDHENEDLEAVEEHNEIFLCHICDEAFKTPKVLTCLHVFCQDCIEKRIEPGTPDEKGSSSSKIIACPVCSQETRVGAKGVAELQPDNVMVNMQDMESIKKMKVICTSCKANEKAVARCSDCANFLCPNCVTAHKYMRCFENHKVVSFEDMGPDFKLHKPLFCSSHPTESLKYFCKSCQCPVCTECMVTSHRNPDHDCERIGEPDDDLIKRQVAALVKEAKGKVEYCEKAAANLEGSLSDLQMQRDDARSLIEETFQTYKAILEEQKGMLLTELEDIHNKHRDSILHLFENVGKTIDKIDDSCHFTERIMEHGNSTEVLLLKRLIFTQLMSLINNTPKADVNVTITFETSTERFRTAMAESFGSFKRHSTNDDSAVAQLHSSFDGENVALPVSLTPADSALLVGANMTQGLANMALTSIAATASLSGVSPQTINSIASSIQSLTGGAGPSIANVASAVTERSGSRNSNCSPAMSDSGIMVDGSAATAASTQHHMVQFAALQRLGSVHASSNGQVILNGTPIPGLHVSNVSGFPGLASGATPALAGATDPALASLLGGMSGPASITAARPSTPLGDIPSSLLQTAPPTISTQFSNPMAALSMPSPTGGFPINTQPPVPPRSTNRVSPMQIRSKFGQLGPGKSQFNSPHGFCLGMDEDIVIADTNNHRIQVFEKNGTFKYHFGIPGREEGQLWYPRKVAVIRASGKHVVCDRGNERSRMQIFTKNGHFIKKIAIRYIDIVAGLAISQAGHIVAVDSVSPTVFVISESGDLIRWFDCSDYMREPSDIAVNGREYFVCDFKGHCVVVFNDEGQFLRRVGCENITNFPNGIDISDAGDVLVGDSHGNRFHVGVFQRDGSLIGEFECPYVKVSRCCGLKITSEGYLVTLAKNNHHVLVLNTLYIS